MEWEQGKMRSEGHTHGVGEEKDVPGGREEMARWNLSCQLTGCTFTAPRPAVCLKPPSSEVQMLHPQERMYPTLEGPAAKVHPCATRAWRGPP